MAKVLQGNQDVVWPINQKVIPVFRLGWLSAHSFHRHCEDNNMIEGLC